MAFNSRWVTFVLSALIAVTPTLLLAQASPPKDAAVVEFFEQQFRPLLADNCFNGHSANTNSRGRLRVNDRNGLLVIAQEESKPDATSEAAEFIKAARANAANFQIQDAKTGKEFERVENPVLRYTVPDRGKGTQGTMWIWGRKGRPVAVLEMIRHLGHEDWFCFHATSDTPIKLTAKSGQTWTPKSSDLKFRPLPDAPLPADSPAGRFRQMKAFARKFTSHEFWENARHEMRVLPAPLHRYEDRERQLLDGAVFAIALGTHPEATLFLEAVHPANEAKPIWQFAIGRSGAAEMVVNYDDNEVHHMPLIETFPPPTNTYWRMVLKVEDNKVPLK